MKRRGFNFASAKHRAGSRIEDMDDRRVPSRVKCDTSECDEVIRPGRPSAGIAVAPGATEDRSARERGHTRVKPYINRLKPVIVPVEFMPNGTIKATINGKVIYVAPTVKAEAGGMAATYRLAGNYYGLTAEEFAKVKVDCPTTKEPTEAELELRKVKIMFDRAEKLFENQGEYFRMLERAEKARAQWEAKYSAVARKEANKIADAQHMERLARKTSNIPEQMSKSPKSRTRE